MVDTIRACIHTGIVENGQMIKVDSIPFPTINDDQLLIKATAYVANPTDYKHISEKWGKQG